MFSLTKFSISNIFQSKRTLLIYTSLFIFLCLIFLTNSPFLTSPLQSTTVATFTSHLFSLTNFTTSFSNKSSTNTTPNKRVWEYALAPYSSSLIDNGSGLIISPAPAPKSSSTSSCDIFDGRWVYDNDSDPVYPPGSCPFISGGFNCFRNGRPDLGYLKYRWQPHGCNITRFDGEKMMEMLRGKRMVFVGDSLNRNMWQSLVCTLNIFSKVSESKVGNHGVISYYFKDFGCSIIFVTAPFLVQQWEIPVTVDHDTPVAKIRLDVMKDTIYKYYDADFLIFNTGHWWNHNKVQNGENFFQEGDVLHKKMDVGEAYRKALITWGKWVDTNVNQNRTHVIFVGDSALHFKGGDWNTGGGCEKEKEPITDDKLLQPYPMIMKTLESVISEMTTPVIYLNITKLTSYRKDGHPSIYRRPGFPSRTGPQDCSHWCLPGVPDSWNQLLFASLSPTS